MSLGAQKMRGFSQAIHEISATAKETVGTLRVLQDGRKFRYAKAGSTALAAGKMCIATKINAAHADENLAAAAAVGDTQLTLTVTAGLAIAANALAGGWLLINDGTGEGHTYAIAGNSAITASGTTLYISLAEPIRVAMAAGSTTQFTLVASPWMGVTASATEENVPVGIPPVAVTADYYCWLQTGGVAAALMLGTPAVGSMLTLGSVAGALTAISSTLDVDQPIVAQQLGTAGVSTEYQPVKLLID